MPDFYVSNVRNSEHFGSVDITLSPIGPNSTSKIVITTWANEVSPKIGEEVAVDIGPTAKQLAQAGKPLITIPKPQAPVAPEPKAPVVPEAKAPEVSNA